MTNRQNTRKSVLRWQKGDARETQGRRRESSGSDARRRSTTGAGVEDGPSGSGPEPPGLHPTGASCQAVPVRRPSTRASRHLLKAGELLRPWAGREQSGYGPEFYASCPARTPPPPAVPPAARGRRSSFCAREQDKSSRATGPSSAPSCPARTPPPSARATKPPASPLQTRDGQLRTPGQPTYTTTFASGERPHVMSPY
nr:sterile alpha motif domain-containing protein 1-like [Dermacentor andersoni]